MHDTLKIDFETCSLCDLKEAGAYEYSMHASTDIMCIAWEWAGITGSWHVYEDRSGLQPLFDLLEAGLELNSEAHNAFFERCIWENVAVRKHNWPPIDPTRWRCSMAACAYKAVPQALEQATTVLGSAVTKDMEGNKLMMRLTRPRNSWKPQKWGLMSDRADIERVTQYCETDIGSEGAVGEIVGVLPPGELRVWQLDQKINFRGMHIDRPLVELCNMLLVRGERDAKKQMQNITNEAVEGPLDVNNLKKWLLARGVPLPTTAKGGLSLPAAFVDEALGWEHLDTDVRDVLQIRSSYAKSSTSKIDKMLSCSESDSRARGLLQYHGATPGRWAGRLIQPQNLPRPTFMVDADLILKLATYDAITNFYGPSHMVVSNVLRGVFRAGPGKLLTAADFGGVESRGLPWLFDEEWKLEAFRAYDRGEGEDNYCMFAEKVVGHPVNAKEHKDIRQTVGKPGELAFGYQGGVGAWRAFDSSDRFTDPEVDEIKNAWRAAHPNTVKGWKALNRAFIEAVYTRREVQCGKVAFGVEGRWAYCRLPKGRKIWYYDPQIAEVPAFWNPEKTQTTVTFWALKSTKSGGRSWRQITAYGGLLTENIVQALCRDLLVDCLFLLEEEQLPVVLTVHDEAITEHDENRKDALRIVEQIMSTTPSWAAGFPLVAEGWTGKRFRK